MTRCGDETRCTVVWAVDATCALGVGSVVARTKVTRLVRGGAARA
jgi:hypothetical protein